MKAGFLNISILVLLVLFATGCATSKLSISKPDVLPHSVNSIALMPSGGVMAEAIGIELLNHGVRVFDTATTTSLMARVNLTEAEIASPQNIRLMADEGVDALLVVKTVAGYDNRPESATARLISTRTGELLVGATWNNGKGGAKGSPADGVMRTNLSKAASKIADGIGEAIH